MTQDALLLSKFIRISGKRMARPENKIVIDRPQVLSLSRGKNAREEYDLVVRIRFSPEKSCNKSSMRRLTAESSHGFSCLSFFPPPPRERRHELRDRCCRPSMGDRKAMKLSS